jgi:hypothetical protein
MVQSDIATIRITRMDGVWGSAKGVADGCRVPGSKAGACVDDQVAATRPGLVAKTKQDHEALIASVTNRRS